MKRALAQAVRAPLLWVLLLMLLPAHAEVYKWVDDRGRVHFTDRPPRGEDAEQLSLRINTYSSPKISKLDSTIGETDRVVMYSASWCAVCKQAKDYFRAEGIPYVEYDVEKSSKGKRDFKKLGGKGVPVILVGNRRINGFSQQAFEQAYRPTR